MKILNCSVVLSCFLCWITYCHAKRGFLLTASKAIDAGSKEYFTFIAFGVPPGGAVSLKLLDWYNGSVLATSEVNVLSNINMWLEMTVPPLPSITKAKLLVQGNFSDGYRINAMKEVQIRQNSILTFVQTDKPIYKPTQTVRFRIMPLDSQLRPLKENTVGDVWIEDPTNIRVAQWKKVSFKRNMVQLELPLSNEPPLGVWSIKTLINDITTTHDFEVKKYVLPKFEVQIKAPDVIMASDKVIPFQICAEYSYGKKVSGKVKIQVMYKGYNWNTGANEYSGLIDGCFTFVENKEKQNLYNDYGGIQVNAEVTENGTDISVNATTVKKIFYTSLLLKFIGTQETEYFKPGIPYYGQLEVTEPNGVPVRSKKIEICAKYYYSYYQSRHHSKCQTFTSNKKGRIRFLLPPQSNSIIKIELEAEAINFDSRFTPSDRIIMKKPTASLTLTGWYSPSDSYLQIKAISDELECNKLTRVKIRYTIKNGTSIKFYHKVISRGRLVQQGSHQRSFYSSDAVKERAYNFEFTPQEKRDHLELEEIANGTTPEDFREFDLHFNPRATMSPVARLLIYYVREDGEVVADSRQFRISKCLINKVEFSFRHEQQYPSTEASLLLSASPSSICGIGMVDKSVLFLKPEKQFNADKVLDIIEGYDVGKNTKPSQITEDYCIKKNEGNKNQTNILKFGRPGTKFGYYTKLVAHQSDSIMAFEDAGMIVMSDFNLEFRPCVLTENPPEPVHFMKLARTSKSFDETPGIAMPMSQQIAKPVSEEQPLEIRSFFPETWLWEMHTIGQNGEMALKRKLPHTITQWVGKAVCVHPKTGLGISGDAKITAFQPFFISFRLPYSVVRGEVLPLQVVVVNYLTECLPIRVSLEPSDSYTILSDARSQMLCVCGDQRGFHKFVLKPTTLGLVNVTVYGYSIEDDDEVCGNEITARLSARDAISKQLRVEAEGFPKEEVYNFFICPQNTNGSYATEVDLIPPEDIVEGSARAFISISGDLMAPALSGLKNLIQLPFGCGEQNMVLFAPNIYVLDYLKASGGVTPEIEINCINNMKTGYQRELQYRHLDGSYSAFGQRDKEGSIWLTAFVLKSFAQAKRFIEIDERELRLSSKWVLDNQFENGCFRTVGHLHHKEMKGGLQHGEHSLAPMTAYIVIAMLESGVVQPNHASVQSAIKCLEEDINPNIYAISLFAYAYALAKEKTLAQKYIKHLEDNAIKRSSTMHWSPSAGSKSVGVEIAAYYILANVELGSIETSSFIVQVIRWLAKQRNPNGGFVSSQDTVVALQALARYSSTQSQNLLDMGLVVEMDGLVKGFKLNEDNKLVSQKVRIPEVPTVVDLQAVGEGCATVQFLFRYNVPASSGSDTFELNVNVTRAGNKNCNLPRISVCIKYKIPQEASNMAVVFIKMVSGFVPLEESLQELMSDSTIGLKRFEIEDNTINFYFDKLTNEQKCFSFHVMNEIEVEDTKSSTVKIYDYYTPELQVTEEYTIPSICTVHLPDLPTIPPFHLPDLPTLSPPDIIDSDGLTYLEPSYEDEIDSTTTTETSHKSTDSNADQVPLISDNAKTSAVTTISTSNPSTYFSDVSSTGSNDAILDVDSPLTTIHSTTVEDSEDISSNDVQLEFPNIEVAKAEEDLEIDKTNYFPNFVDVDNDLSFPDGIEGNAPVSVLPPPSDESFSTSPTSECPVCYNQFPPDFDNLYCSASIALRATVEEKSIKILEDVSLLLSQPDTIMKNASLQYYTECDCPILHQEDTILILSNDRTLWNTEKDIINLTAEVNIIPLTSNTTPIAEITRALSACSDDP